jgi:DNA-binding transcriptional ArsR family regulator
MATGKPGKTSAAVPACDADEHARRQPGAPRSDAEYAAAADLFRAAGDVARLRLIVRLAEGEWCVTELAQGANATLPAVSQQLSILRAARIVSQRKAGRHIYYSLHDTHVLELIQNALDHVSEDPKGRL